MIAAWMLYCALGALGLFVAATVAEHVLLAGRRAVRPVWLGAVLLSLALPVAALRSGSGRRPAPVAVDTRQGVARGSSAMLSISPPPPVVGPAQAPVATPEPNWRAIVARTDRPLLLIWLVLSAVLALYFAGGMVVLALMRRGWRRHVVLDVPVLVSQRVGPALVGAVSPAIVLPEWALSMEPRQLALMLKHEEEHRRARDGQVLTAAQLALIVMPWNVALWWQVLRLRMAVELDCDARVLRDADARSYGDLLLEVVRPSRRFHLMGATAFAERASQLERRLRMLAKPRGRAVRGSRAAAVLIGFVAAGAAWAAPRPAVPLITVFEQNRVVPAGAATPGNGERGTTAQSPALSSPDSRISPPATGTLPKTVATAADGRTHLASSVASNRRTDGSTFAGDTVVTSRGYVGDSVAVAARGAIEVPGDDSLLFHRLFDGISLTASQQAAAHALLESLMRRQIAANVSAITSGLQARSQQQGVIAARDSALRTLVSNDGDRALLATRMAPGARGRSGARPDGPGGGRGARSSGAPVDMSGARGRSGGTAAGSMVTVEMQFNRLFDGITLTPEQASTARRLIDVALQGMQQGVPRPMTVIQALPWGVIAVQPEGATALLALLPNVADRQVLESRLAIATQPTSMPPRR